MLSKRCGTQIKLKRIFSPVFLAALHSSDDVTQYTPVKKLEDKLKILKTKTVMISKP